MSEARSNTVPAAASAADVARAPAALAVRAGTLRVSTHGPGCYDISADVAGWLAGVAASAGLLTLFIRHTSASLLIQENADPDVQRDLLDWLRRLAPAGSHYRHESEGPDDMPAHIKAMVMPVSLSIPVANAAMRLGTWQGLYVVEHRDRPHTREVEMQYIGTIG